MWRCCVVSGSLALLCICLQYAYFAWSFQNLNDLNGIQLPLLGLCIGVFILFKSSTSGSQIWTARNLLLTTPIIPIRSSIVGCLITASLALSTYLTLWFGGLTLSMVVYELGFFETGEYIFSKTPIPQSFRGDISLSSVEIRYQQTNVKQPNRTIAKIYGENSRQMAYNNIKLALISRAEGDFDRSEKWFKTALKIYARRNCALECVQVLSMIAKTQVDEGKLWMATETVNNALGLLTHLADSDAKIQASDHLRVLAATIAQERLSAP